MVTKHHQSGGVGWMTKRENGVGVFFLFYLFTKGGSGLVGKLGLVDWVERIRIVGGL